MELAERINNYGSLMIKGFKTADEANEIILEGSNIIQSLVHVYLEQLESAVLPDIFKTHEYFESAILIHNKSCEAIGAIENPFYRLRYIMMARIVDFLFVELENIRQTCCSDDDLKAKSAADALDTLLIMHDIQNPDLRTCYDTMNMMCEVIIELKKENLKLITKK